MGGGITLHTKCKEYLNIVKKTGKFYNLNDIDALIVGEVFGYKVLSGNRVGFPDNALDKVLLILDEKEISYKVINNDLEVLSKYFINNTYGKYAKIALKQINNNDKIVFLIDKVKHLDKNELSKLLEVIYEYFTK